jgi:hypothetical protein
LSERRFGVRVEREEGEREMEEREQEASSR